MAGNRIRTWRLMPTDRMGPPPGALPPMRMTASWSGSILPHTSLRHEDAPHGELPSDSTHRQTDTDAMQKAPLAVHHRSACSAVKALRNTSVARRQAAKLCYRFGPLTPSARSASSIAGDGTKNGFCDEQRTCNNQNDYLTGKAPYRFESGSIQRRVTCEPKFRFSARHRQFGGPHRACVAGWG